jgi:hypothetical protein
MRSMLNNVSMGGRIFAVHHCRSHTALQTSSLVDAWIACPECRTLHTLVYVP